MTDLNGKVVLVAGSSRGIGAEIAVAFAGHGAKVVLRDRDIEALAMCWLPAPAAAAGCH